MAEGVLYRNIGLRICFDGSEYNGWQRQPHGNTVEDVITRAIYRFEKRPTVIIGASRTDSGVHANGQYLNFFSYHNTVPIHKYPAAINRYLPSSIVILESKQHLPHFHSRYSAKKRTYLYKIRISAHQMPVYRKYYLIVARPPHVMQCNRALSVLCGTHDFYSFAKSAHADNNSCSTSGGKPSRSTIRTVYSASMYVHAEAIHVKICANAFLRNMVRAIMGTILNTSLCTPEYMQKMLHARDTSLGGETVPAHGLYLDWVSYE